MSSEEGGGEVAGSLGQAGRTGWGFVGSPRQHRLVVSVSW